MARPPPFSLRGLAAALSTLTFALSAHAGPAGHGKTAHVVPSRAAHAAGPARVQELPTRSAGTGELRGRLTLDPELQAKMLRILDESRAPGGAIVVSDVRTGRVLAWASRGPGDWVKEPYAPSASVFKLVTATALLEGHKVSLATRQCYSDAEHGISEADLLDGPRDIGCMPFSEALGFSINAIFARLATRYLSPGDMRRSAEAIGFGGKVPIDLDASFGDAKIPDDRLGLARASAGFWNARLSPLGALFAMQTIANGGEKIRLHVHDTGAPVQRVSVGRAMSRDTAEALTRMLEVTTRRGTAAKAFHDQGRPALGVAVAGKTGTLVGGHPSRMYSWFTGFAPTHKPEIAVAVMLANDVAWWSKGNLVARRVFEAYFEARR